MNTSGHLRDLSFINKLAATHAVYALLLAAGKLDMDTFRAFMALERCVLRWGAATSLARAA